MIDAYASRPHYAAHLQPIWDALPDELRGTFYRPTAAGEWGDRQMSKADNPSGLVLVAGGSDARKFAHRPVILLEHGAGQSYPGDPQGLTTASYAGGEGLGHVRLFLCPSEAVCERWRATYPEARAVAVGCPWLDDMPARRAALHEPDAVTVGITWHWDCQLVPETRSAWDHYRYRSAELRDAARASGVRLVASQHPRWSGHSMAPLATYAPLGVDYTTQHQRFLALPDLVVADNSSALYEAAALGIPTVVMNAPWYRREVHHGLRFWDDIPGREVDHPDDLWPAIVDQLEHDAHAADRRRIAAEVYALPIGAAATAAVEAITEATT